MSYVMWVIQDYINTLKEAHRREEAHIMRSTGYCCGPNAGWKRISRHKAECKEDRIY